jgi:acylphosphatase
MRAVTYAAAAVVLLLLTRLSLRATEESAMTARRVHYAGRVQGVGFRATTVEIARDHPVTGWVKNLSDGRVELHVEGTEAAVDKFLEAVRKRWKDNIDKETVEKQTPGGKLKGFEIVQ